MYDINESIFYKDIIDSIESLRDNIALSKSTLFIADAQAICALFCLIYMALRLYPVIAGDEELKITPLLKPFLIALVINWWPNFVDICNTPGRIISERASNVFVAEYSELKTVSASRFELVDEAAWRVMKEGVIVSRAEDAERNVLMKAADIAKQVINPLGLSERIAAMGVLVQNQQKKLLHSILEHCALLFMNVCVCGVFLLQAIAMLVLALLGPFSFAASVLPVWRDAWAHWIARFFSVSLWSGLAYIFIWMNCMLMKQFLEVETNIMKERMEMGDRSAAMLYSFNYADIIYFPLLCLLCAFTLFAVFPVSTWIIQTSGAHTIISAPAGAAATTAGAAVAGAAKIG
jgi:hypothetical protein